MSIGHRRILGIILVAGAVLAGAILRLAPGELFKARPGSSRAPISMTVRGFITNCSDYFPRDYVCAIIDVTNRSARTFVSMPMRSQSSLVQSVQDAKVQRPGVLPNFFVQRSVFPRSGFTFGALMWRGSTNRVDVFFLSMPKPLWPLTYLPAGMAQKIPRLLWSSGEPLIVSTGPFSLGGAAR